MICDLQQLVCTQRVPVRWPVGCEADTLFYVKVSDAERLLREIKRLETIVDTIPNIDQSDRVWMSWALKLKAAEKARKP